ncbi:predicted protein, partial [Nematostella vectensis]
LIAGGIAGGVSRTCVSPLERVKMLLQIQVTNAKYSGVGGTLAKIYRDEGLYGYFKGNGTNIVRIVPYTAVQFAAYEEFKKVLNSETPLLKIPQDPREQHPFLRLTAGSLAGIVSCTATYPLDLVRYGSLLEIVSSTANYPLDLVRYGSLLEIVSSTANYPLGLGIAPYIGLNFMVYETMKGMCFRRPITTIHHDLELPVVAKLFCGAVAGAVAQSGTYPLDVVRRRMQMERGEGMFKYSSTWDGFKVIVRSEGFIGLFKGMWPNLLKVAPTIGIQFAVYEVSKSAMYARME